MKKRHSLIVGGTRGIGRALAKLWSAKGHDVSVIGRRQPEECGQESGEVCYWILDILDEQRCAACLAEIFKKRGKLNNLVFCQRYRGSGDDWEQEMKTSLTATKRIIEGSVDQFDDSNENAIVIVGSAAGRAVAEEQPLSYHVAKAGLEQMVRYYAVTLAVRGIRVNCVVPAVFTKEESETFHSSKSERLRHVYESITPIGRMVSAEEIARVIAFLCSRDASVVTGQRIAVDAGLSLQSQASVAKKLAM